MIFYTSGYRKKGEKCRNKEMEEKVEKSTVQYIDFLKACSLLRNWVMETRLFY